MYSFSTGKMTGSVPLPQNTNILNYSILNNFQHKVPFRRFAIKYVVSGKEEYTVNGNKYEISDGSYLLANQFAEGSITINNNIPVKGICIDLSPDLLSEAVGSIVRPDTPFADMAINTFFNAPEFLENCYVAKNTLTGLDLLNLSTILSKNPDQPREVPDDLFFTIAEHLVVDHIPICKQLQNVKAIKYSTKKDLYRRLLKGKFFIDENFAQSPSIRQIAAISNLSEFHFFRLFKQTFGTTPYQYVLERKLQYAYAKLKTQSLSITEIAFQSGFADVHAFSKAFKKQFGIAPGNSRIG